MQTLFKKPMETPLLEISQKIRTRIIRMHLQGTGVGSSLSITDILTILYFDTMNIKTPNDPDRDRFVLSKGHAAAALYATLEQKQFFNSGVLDNYLDEGGPLRTHPTKGSLPGIEATTGSLGHGFPIAVGMAWAAKQDNKNYRVYTLMGDGECQEGSVWETAMIAARLKLNNLIGIIDVNDCQGYGRVDPILPLNSFKAKWESFGWNVVEVDGHNIRKLKKVFKQVPVTNDKPSMIIAHTVMGKGIREMEGKFEWHYYSVPKEKEKCFISEIEDQYENSIR